MHDTCLIPSLDAGTRATLANIDRTSLDLSDLRILAKRANLTSATRMTYQQWRMRLHIRQQQDLNNISMSDLSLYSTLYIRLPSYGPGRILLLMRRRRQGGSTSLT